MDEADAADRTDEQKAHLAAAEPREAYAPVQTWWLSFADETGFLGVAIVRARGVFDAIGVCRERRCGTEGRGEVRADPVPEGEIDESWYFRLLTAYEVDQLNAELAAKNRP